MLICFYSVIYLIFCLQVTDLAAITENRGSLNHGLEEEIKGEQTQDSVEFWDRNWLVVAGSVLVTSAVISVLTIIMVNRRKDNRSFKGSNPDTCDVCCSLCLCCCLCPSLANSS